VWQTKISQKKKKKPCSLELLISHNTIFFSHNKTVLAGLSAAETNNQKVWSRLPRRTLPSHVYDNNGACMYMQWPDFWAPIF
jgi:hypothetical protein